MGFREDKEARIRELEANPRRRKYAEMMRRGGWWTDEQIAYHENADMTVTCTHLQAVECAMRAAGIVPHLLTTGWGNGLLATSSIEVDCMVDEAALRKAFPLAECVRYLQGFMPERWKYDNPWARLECVADQSRIELVHPEWGRPTTRWFPVNFSPERPA